MAARISAYYSASVRRVNTGKNELSGVLRHSLQFGFCVPIFALPGGALFRTPNFSKLDCQIALRSARMAETLGYDSIWVADHLMLGEGQSILEGWTTLSAIAGMTKRAKLGLIHQGHYFRIPSVVAKMIATLDQISAGRFIFFADTGLGLNEHRAYGLNYPENAEERIEEFLEGLDLIMQLWQTSEELPLNFYGTYYQVYNAVCKPSTMTQPHPPIWFGEAHALTFDAAARFGQGWNSVPVGLAVMHQRLGALREACNRVGRSYFELEISLEIQILCAPTRTAVREKLQSILALTPVSSATPQEPDFTAFLANASDEYPRYLTETGLVGTPDEIRVQLQRYIDIGVSHFLLWFVDAPDINGMQLFMDQVVPMFRPVQFSEG